MEPQAACVNDDMLCIMEELLRRWEGRPADEPGNGGVPETERAAVSTIGRKSK
jgi:hypothetical protein